MLPIGTILHPTDFSEQSGYAFQIACALARDHGAGLLVLHIAPVPFLVPPYSEAAALPVDLSPYADGPRKKLDQLASSAAGVRVECRLLLGADPVTEIVRAARVDGCGLVVMGTHGRSGLPRALVGSVAEGVVRRAPCPVLTVRTPFPPAQAPDTPALS
jgi:nucleotide-binding universal stress UspA family protein